MMTPIYGDFAEVYSDSEYTNFSATMSEAVVRLVTRLVFSPRRVLDLACGVGVAAVFFAERGYEVIGVDRSERMLDFAKQRAEEAGVAVQWDRQDMRTLALPAPVDLITCMYGSLNYMATEEDFTAACRAAAQNLSPGGLFVFDVLTIRGLADASKMKSLVHESAAGHLILHQNKFDFESSLNTKVLTVFVKRGRDYARITEIHRERAFSLETMERALGSAGFTVLERFSGAALKPLKPESARALYVARLEGSPGAARSADRLWGYEAG
jgi:2-polyprenyl-3-methyl-5-hydroxy-6-metoxy-1,4-benzoquinol methylase